MMTRFEARNIESRNAFKRGAAMLSLHITDNDIPDKKVRNLWRGAHALLGLATVVGGSLLAYTIAHGPDSLPLVVRGLSAGASLMGGFIELLARPVVKVTVLPPDEFDFL